MIYYTKGKVRKGQYGFGTQDYIPGETFTGVTPGVTPTASPSMTKDRIKKPMQFGGGYGDNQSKFSNNTYGVQVNNDADIFTNKGNIGKKSMNSFRSYAPKKDRLGEYVKENNTRLNTSNVGSTHKIDTSEEIKGKAVDGGIDATYKVASGDTASGISGAALTATDIGGTYLNDKLLSDDNETTYTDKERYGDVTKSAVMGASAVALPALTSMVVGAAAGSAFPVIGTVIGAVIGLGVGIFTASKNKKKAEETRVAQNRTQERKAGSAALKDLMDSQKGLSRKNKSYTDIDQGGSSVGGYGTQMSRLGGKLTFSDLITIKNISKKKVPTFKKGGSLASSVNIIPNGVLHEEDNSLGDKGMPVVKCNLDKTSCEKKYEIEKEELITTLEVTKKIEELAKGGKVKELGKYLALQLTDNTHSFSSKYKGLDKIN